MSLGPLIGIPETVADGLIVIDTDDEACELEEAVVTDDELEEAVVPGFDRDTEREAEVFEVVVVGRMELVEGVVLSKAMLDVVGTNIISAQ